MISGVCYFFLACVISFVGSLQPGPVNMAVITSAAIKAYKNALLIALGGSLPECVFSGIALYSSQFITQHQWLFIWFKYFLIAVFILAGIYLLLSKTKVESTVFKRKGFVLGFWLASINPQLIFFWVSVFALLHSNGYPLITVPIWIQIAFLLGTSFGAFVLHYILIGLVRKYEAAKVVSFIAQKSNKIIGTLLLAIGIFQGLNVFIFEKTI